MSYWQDLLYLHDCNLYAMDNASTNEKVSQQDLSVLLRGLRQSTQKITNESHIPPFLTLAQTQAFAKENGMVFAPDFAAKAILRPSRIMERVSNLAYSDFLYPDVEFSDSLTVIKEALSLKTYQLYNHTKDQALSYVRNKELLHVDEAIREQVRYGLERGIYSDIHTSEESVLVVHQRNMVGLGWSFPLFNDLMFAGHKQKPCDSELIGVVGRDISTCQVNSLPFSSMVYREHVASEMVERFHDRIILERKQSGNRHTIGLAWGAMILAEMFHWLMSDASDSLIKHHDTVLATPDAIHPVTGMELSDKGIRVGVTTGVRSISKKYPESFVILLKPVLGGFFVKEAYEL